MTLSGQAGNHRSSEIDLEKEINCSVILSTPMAGKVAGNAPWIHHTQTKKIKATYAAKWSVLDYGAIKIKVSVRPQGSMGRLPALLPPSEVCVW